MKDKTFVVELEPNVWFASCDGDPGRTLLKSNATRHASYDDAVRSLDSCRAYRPFVNAKIVRMEAQQ
jgi:hypothetical protein